MVILIYSYKVFRLLPLLVLFLTYCHIARAQVLTGCGKNLTGVIHYQRNGFGTGLGNTAKFRYDAAPFSTLTTNTAICPRFTIFAARVPTTLCCIGTDCGLDNFLYDFTNIPCPIDDYIPALLLSTGALGLFVIRRKATKQGG